MDDHKCTQEARIDLVVDMLKKIQEKQDLLLGEYYKQQGKMAVISISFSGVISFFAWIWSSK